MKTSELLDQISAHVRDNHVFGQPYERDGVTVIPAAVLYAGGGGGGSTGVDDRGQAGEQAEPAVPQGVGGGLGLVARPVGAFVIKGGEVRWQPAFDLTRVVIGGQLVAIVGLLTARRLIRVLDRRRRRS
jgi:uncharacterized spore protein YtfJ